jgi:hypothetical protein
MTPVAITTGAAPGAFHPLGSLNHVEVNETDLVFACPEVDEEAILRVHFVRPIPPNNAIGRDRSAKFLDFR